MSAAAAAAERERGTEASKDVDSAMFASRIRDIFHQFATRSAKPSESASRENLQ